MKLWLCREDEDYWLYSGNKPRYSTDSRRKPVVWQVRDFNNDMYLYLGKRIRGFRLKPWTCVRVKVAPTANG